MERREEKITEVWFFFVHSSKHVYYLINSFTLVLEQNYSQKLQQVHLSSYCKAEFEKGMSVM